MDFLAENNLCGQTLLRLVSRGSAIITELLRLSDFIPPVFKFDGKNEQNKYAELMSDFSYFKNTEFFENRIITKPVCQILIDFVDIYYPCNYIVQTDMHIFYGCRALKI